MTLGLLVSLLQDALLEGVEVLVVVDVENGWYNWSENGLVFRIHVEGVSFLPAVVADSGDSEHKIDDIFVDVSKSEMPEEDLNVISENIRER